MRKNRCMARALACTGAVIGAGFASGREVVVFFTRYGVHSWWLILLAVGVMTGLCAACVRLATRRGTDCWCELYADRSPWVRRAARGCAALLMAVTGGAMVSAAGHMVALVWASEWAYAVGAAATLALAWALGFGSLRPLTWVSGVLTALLMGAMVLALSHDMSDAAAVVAAPPTAGELVLAALRAAAYAAMNLTLAIGVMCRCRARRARENCRMSVLFGLVMLALLFLSNYVYLTRPSLVGEAFPVVRLMSGLGRAGFLASVALMYLAILTTLAAVVDALRSEVSRHVTHPGARACFTLGLPLAVSCVGFEGIVEGLYAPVGAACLALVFAPLLVSYRKRGGGKRRE